MYYFLSFCYCKFNVFAIKASPCPTEAQRLCLKKKKKTIGRSVALDCIRLHQWNFQNEQRVFLFFLYLKDKVFLVSSVHIRGWCFLGCIEDLIRCYSKKQQKRTRSCSVRFLLIFPFTYLFIILSLRHKKAKDGQPTGDQENLVNGVSEIYAF